MTASIAHAQQPPNCAVGGFVVSPDSTIWVCTGLSTTPTQVSTGGGNPAWGAITGTLADQTDLQTVLDGKQAAGSYLAPNGNGGSLTGLTKTQVGLSNVDNTADANKNVLSATKLTTARTINGTSFDGTANVTVTAAGSTLSDNVPTSKLNSGTNASATTFWRGDATWATPAGGSDPFATFKGILASDVSTGANTTPVNVTGLVFTYEANATYFIEVTGAISSAAATTGAGMQFDLSSAVTSVWFTFDHQLANTGTLTGGNSIADDASAGVSSGISANGAIVPFKGSGILKTTGNTGTAQLRYRSETTAVTTIKAGTVMRVQKVS